METSFGAIKLLDEDKIYNDEKRTNDLDKTNVKSLDCDLKPEIWSLFLHRKIISLSVVI